MDIRIPEDLFILQIAAQPNTTGQTLTSFYAAIDEKLGVKTLIRLYFLIRACVSLLERFDYLAGHSELLVGDDGFLYFCEYCLSLPRERLESYLKNPYHELISNRIYYASPTGEIYEREGYLHYELRDYINLKYPDLEIEKLKFYANSKTYIKNYVNQLTSLEISYG